MIPKPAICTPQAHTRPCCVNACGTCGPQNLGATLSTLSLILTNEQHRRCYLSPLPCGCIRIPSCFTTQLSQVTCMHIGWTSTDQTCACKLTVIPAPLSPCPVGETRERRVRKTSRIISGRSSIWRPRLSFLSRLSLLQIRPISVDMLDTSMQAQAETIERMTELATPLGS